MYFVIYLFLKYFCFAPSSIPTPTSANGHHFQQQHAAHSQQHLQHQFNGPGSAPAGPSCCSSADSGHHSASGSISGGTGGDFFRRPSSSSSNVQNQSHQQQNYDHLRLHQQSLIKVDFCHYYFTVDINLDRCVILLHQSFLQPPLQNFQIFRL
jgi:hypothetical protein